MNEELILEKLDKLTGEVQSLKSGVLRELKQDLEPVLKQTQPGITGFFQEFDGEYSNEKLTHLVRTMLTSLEELNEVVTAIKAGVELKDDMMPVVQQVYPKSIKFFADLEGDFHIDELITLFRKALTNLDAVGEGLDMLKTGVELRDDMVPVLQLMYPRLQRFFNSLDEGEFQAEKLGDLLRTILLNIPAITDLLNMVQPMTELVKELEILMKETDVLNGVNIWLDGMQQAFGFFFMILQAVGSCLQTYQDDREQQNVVNA